MFRREALDHLGHRHAHVVGAAWNGLYRRMALDGNGATVTPAGMGMVDATVKVPSPLFTAPARALMEMGWAGVLRLPVLV